MSIGDLIITTLIFLVQKTILPILPASLPFFPIGSLTAITNSDLKSDLIFALSGFGNLLPINLILTFLVVIIFAEITLLTIRMAKFVINLVRGSGA